MGKAAQAHELMHKLQSEMGTRALVAPSGEAGEGAPLAVVGATAVSEGGRGTTPAPLRSASSLMIWWIKSWRWLAIKLPWWNQRADIKLSSLEPKVIEAEQAKKEAERARGEMDQMIKALQGQVLHYHDPAEGFTKHTPAISSATSAPTTSTTSPPPATSTTATATDLMMGKLKAKMDERFGRSEVGATSGASSANSVGHGEACVASGAASAKVDAPTSPAALAAVIGVGATSQGRLSPCLRLP